MVRFRLDPLLRITLALTLALASVAAASAHGRGMPAQRILVCSGGMLVTISTGPDGTPVERTQLCPDKACALFSALVQPLTIAAPAQVGRATLIVRNTPLRQQSPGAPFHARAPPVRPGFRIA